MRAARLIIATVVSLLLTCALPFAASAAKPAPKKINPAFEAPVLQPVSVTKNSAGLLHVTLRTAEQLTAAQQKQLQNAGFKPLKAKQQWVHIGSIYSGSVAKSNLKPLADLSFVKRIDPAFSRTERPMDQARVANGIDEAYSDYTDANGLPITGEGVTICIDDSRIDIFHPAFFNPDGGEFFWIDVNENNVFDRGVDAVDLNENGAADAGEILSFFDAHLNVDYYADAENKDNVFQADLDYLYNDANNDGARQFGPDTFTEDAPSYGEMLFMVRDDNENNALDVGETLIALGSSKVKEAYVYNAMNDAVDVYTRGENLIDYPFHEDSYVSHGTGTAGISASGTAFHRLRGVAYKAEIVLVESSIATYLNRETHNYRGMAADFGFCKMGGAQVTLHEYCMSSEHPLDGSSNDALAIAEAEGEGLIPICPSCNYNGSKKFSQMRVPPFQTLTNNVILDPEYPMNGIYYLSASFRWRQPDRNVKLSIKKPNGEWLAISGGWGQYANGIQYYGMADESDRGTVTRKIILYSSEQGPWLEPPYEFQIENPGQTPLDVWAFVGDNVSGFQYGLIFEDFANDGTPQTAYISTFTLPAGADGGIGIAAHEHRDGKTGLADYSGGGLRIDGMQTVHVSGTYAQMTPGAHFSPSRSPYDSYEHGNFLMFGGTSSSSPLMAGIAALLLQKAPEIDAPGMRKALRDSSDNSLALSSPDLYWGWGAVQVPAMLDAAATAMDDSEPPVVSIYSEDVGAQGERMVFSGAGSLDDRGIVSWQWSVEDPGAAPSDTDNMWYLHTFANEGEYTVTLTVTDEAGNTASASKTVTIISMFGEYPNQDLDGCAGGCNLWQPDSCMQGTAIACSCADGTWHAIRCEESCASQGFTGGACAMNADTGAAECQCTGMVDGDIDGIEDSDEDPEIDGDMNEDTEDDSTDTAETVDNTDTVTPKPSSGSDGCAGGSASLLFLLAGIMAFVRRRR